MSTVLVNVSDEVAELAARSPDVSKHREIEPYRLAISFMYARLAATQTALNGLAPARSAVGPAPAYRSCSELLDDLRKVQESLAANGATALTLGRLRRLQRAIDCFGFHLASLDMRQNSDVHESTIAELLEAVDPGREDSSNWTRMHVSELLSEELSSKRPLLRSNWTYSEQTDKGACNFSCCTRRL